jgi:aminoglycoside 6'-N-acetyltransferase
MAADQLIVEDADLAIRRMADADDEYARIAAWRNRPHVREWWDPDQPPMTTEAAVAEYRADVLGRTATRAAIIEASGTPVGFIQYYPWAAYADSLAELGITVPDGAWGLDVFIGEPQWVGRGIGSRAVRLLCDHLLRDRGASAIAFGVAADNARARRAYEKAGLVPTVEFLDTDTRDGERMTSVLMLRSAGSLPPAR